MLDEQRIRNLRDAGWGYKAIAGFTGLTRDQVRSYCRTRHIDAAALTVETVCEWCGAPISPRTCRATYCSPSCRHKAWRTRLKTTPGRERACVGCGAVFTVVDKPKHQYCCHACYIRSRFGTRGGRP